MSSLYTHRIWCNTEGAFVSATKTDSVLLTTCPNNAAHAVDLGSAEIISTTPAQNKDPLATITTYGNVRADSFAVSAAAGGSGTTTKTWEVNIALYTIRAAVTAACVGCNITVESAPLTTVGTLTADAPIGTTVLSVTPSAAAAITPGVVVTLQMGVTVQEVGLATAVNKALNTVTVDTATTSNFLAAGPTAVKMTKRAAQNLELPLEGYLTFGETRSQSVGIPAGRALAVTLNNPNAAPARLVVIVSYNY